jgi:hypothetical protein
MAEMSVWKKINLVVTVVSVVLLAYVVVLVLHKAPPPDIAYDSRAAARAEEKFQAADQAKAAGRSSQVQLDPTELNSYLHQNLGLMGADGTSPSSVSRPSTAPNGKVANDSAPPADPAASVPGADPATVAEARSTVRDVKVDMEGDLIKAYVIFDIHGEDLSLQLEGRLHAENGYLKFDPVSGKLGSLPLPQSTLDSAVSRLMSSPENRESLRLPPDVADVQIVNGQAVVIYK